MQHQIGSWYLPRRLPPMCLFPVLAICFVYLGVVFDIDGPGKSLLVMRRTRCFLPLALG
ncbi:unnamed protein product [Arabidopsis thaliana]|uniref:(thale cress) hypothetical protein n=1 Tax=Arabidopsis thaliana TaxID=3702 RepID=A0A7G2F9U3_ARATH|nr:unnamed protein product [Arabidopsis thaliana]